MASGALVVLIALTVLAVILVLLCAVADEALDKFTRSKLAALPPAPWTERAYKALENRHHTENGLHIWGIFGYVLAAISLAVLLTSTLPTWYVALCVSFVAMAVLVLFLMFISPRAWARHSPEKALKITAGLMLAAGRFAHFTGYKALRAEKYAPENEADLEEQPLEEIENLVAQASEEGTLSGEDREMLTGVFELGRTLVREVMVPRPDMVTLTVTDTPDTAFSLFTRSGFSRVPVFDARQEEVKGIVYLKDVLRRTHHRFDAQNLTVADIMRPPVFVPETLLADELLQQLRRERVHIAVAVDEWGSVAGLVTIEDLLEELVGELSDEHDREMEMPEALEDGSWRLPVRYELDDLGEFLGLSLDDDDVTTLGGFLSKQLGKVPIAGDEVTFGPYRFTAERVEGRRKKLASVIVSKIDTEDSGAGATE